MTRRTSKSETLTTSEFATALGIAEGTARAHADELGAIQIGRILRWPRSTLARLLNSTPDAHQQGGSSMVSSTLVAGTPSATAGIPVAEGELVHDEGTLDKAA